MSALWRQQQMRVNNVSHQIRHLELLDCFLDASCGGRCLRAFVAAAISSLYVFVTTAISVSG